MSAWEGLNRRKFPRVNYPCMVVINNSTELEEAILTHTENVGIGGICAMLKRSLKVYTPVDLEIDLLDHGDHIICKGKIVWCIRRKELEARKPLAYDVGIEFVGLDQRETQRIESIVQRLFKQR